jgi:homogentisate 1,2-dioxygenase
VPVRRGRHRDVETTFGELRVGTGDYVIIPTSVVHRIVPEGPVRMLTIEATGHIGPPRRYLSVRGQFLEHSPYCERDQRGPDAPLQVERRRRGVREAPRRLDQARVRASPVRRGRLGRLPVPVGVLDPRLRADHRPGAPAAAGAPDVRGAELRGLLVRAAQGRLSPAGDPGAVQPPQRRLDEVLFYTGGNYEAAPRLGIEQGSISLHPSGFTHGPQPGAVERAIGVEFFDELAVMVDTFRPLDLCEAGLSVEDTGYAWTWNR